MSVVVINQLHLSRSVDDPVPSVAEQFPAAFDALDGFERSSWSRSPMTEPWLIYWRDGPSAEAGAASLGPTLFARLIGPNLASEQVRSMGSVVVHHAAVPGA